MTTALWIQIDLSRPRSKIVFSGGLGPLGEQDVLLRLHVDGRELQAHPRQNVDPWSGFPRRAPCFRIKENRPFDVLVDHLLFPGPLGGDPHHDGLLLVYVSNHKKGGKEVPSTKHTRLLGK